MWYPYDELNFADFSVSFEPAPEDNVTKEIEFLQGVRDFEGRLILEIPIAFSTKTPEFISGRIISLPDNFRPSVNDVLVVDGNYFYGDGRDEILLEIAFAKHHNLAVGDTVYVKTEEQLKSFEVVGKVISPEYIWPAKNIVEHMPDVLRRWGVLFMPKSLMEQYFNYTGLINEVSVLIESSSNLEAVATEVESVLTPFGVNKVVTRENQPSNKIIDMMIGSLDSLALVFPIFFLIVAALSTYIVLTRMVYLQARQIG
ncbi:hypothetical protein GTO27_11965, partial [Candidatus Bathyarchaeota archaeon]|nr:hypothetical protein [Candidatus Bathyarchaeota archaeon]